MFPLHTGSLAQCVMVDKADQVMLPAVFLQISQEFSIGPALLGTITLARGLTQALVALFAGPLGARMDRMKLLSFGCVAWGVATFLCALAPSPGFLLVARCLNGVGLGLAIPVIQALTSDLFPPEERGRAYGTLNAADSLGGTLGGVFVVIAAGHDRCNPRVLNQGC